jgi:hypothetical protein
MTRKTKIISWPSRLTKFEQTLHGNRKDISKSKTRNKIAIRKNLIEKGSPGLWTGSNPHS